MAALTKVQSGMIIGGVPTGTESEEVFTGVVGDTFMPEVYDWKIFRDWDARTLSNGIITEWQEQSSDGIRATQSDATKLPEKKSDGVYFEPGKFLEIPFEINNYRAHHMLHVVFKHGTINDEDSTVVYFNNEDGGIFSAQPKVNLKASTQKIRPFWRDAGSSGARIDIDAVDDVWHSLILRCENGTLYASLDGAAEVTAAGILVRQGPNNQQPVGKFGDSRGLTQIVLDRVTLYYDQDWTSTEIDKLHGWAMWRKGVQANLPGGHAYASAKPLIEAGDAPSVNTITSSSEWDTFVTNLTTNKTGVGGYQAAATFGSALDTNIEAETGGWALDYEQDFTGATTPVTRDYDGDGPFYGPQILGGAGDLGATLADPSDSDVYEFDAVNNLFKLKMQNNKGGGFATVNQRGDGTVGYLSNGTWDSSNFQIYYEISTALSSDGDDAWFIWSLRSRDEFKQGYKSRLEEDIIEAFSGFPNLWQDKTHHSAGYRQVAAALSDPAFVARSAGPDTDLTAAPFSEASGVLYDGNQHKYGCLITDTHVIRYWDQTEIGRFLVQPEYQQPLYPTVQMFRKNDTPYGTLATAAIDYIRVYKGPAV